MCHIARRRAFIDELEFELGGLAQQALERLRIVEAGNLHDDAVLALADDRRLARAQGVDTLAHDFNGRVHGIGDRLIETFTGRRQHETAAVLDADVPVALAGEASAGRQRQDLVARGIDLRGVLEHERETAVGTGNVADADTRFGQPQPTTNRLFHVFQTLLLDLAFIGL